MAHNGKTYLRKSSIVVTSDKLLPVSLTPDEALSRIFIDSMTPAIN
jgi:hypothetical protein